MTALLPEIVGAEAPAAARSTAKGAMARLAGQELPKWDDNEASLEDLRTRIRKTMDYVASFTPAQIDGTEDRAEDRASPSRERLTDH